jgi:hypothetical protein
MTKQKFSLAQLNKVVSEKQKNGAATNKIRFQNRSQLATKAKDRNKPVQRMVSIRVDDGASTGGNYCHEKLVVTTQDDKKTRNQNL